MITATAPAGTSLFKVVMTVHNVDSLQGLQPLHIAANGQGSVTHLFLVCRKGAVGLNKNPLDWI
jgi:hypothetical protein